MKHVRDVQSSAEGDRYPHILSNKHTQSTLCEEVTN